MTDEELVKEISAKAFRACANPTRLPELFQLLDEKKPSAEIVARAIVDASAAHGGTYDTRIQGMLGAYLQLLLTREHVIAQEKMSYSAGFLAAAGVFLAGVTLFASCSGMSP